MKIENIITRGVLRYCLAKTQFRLIRKYGPRCILNPFPQLSKLSVSLDSLASENTCRTGAFLFPSSLYLRAMLLGPHICRRLSRQLMMNIFSKFRVRVYTLLFQDLYGAFDRLFLQINTGASSIIFGRVFDVHPTPLYLWDYQTSRFRMKNAPSCVRAARKADNFFKIASEADIIIQPVIFTRRN